MKYQALSASLLVFTAFVLSPAYASDSNNSMQSIRDTKALQQTANEMDAVLKQLATKYNQQILALGLSDEQLNAIVYMRPDWMREPIPFSTVKEFAAIFFAQPECESVNMIKYGEYLGFKLKTSGRLADGYALYPQENTYLLKGVVDDEGLLETSDAREEELLFQLFRKKAMIALTENGFKG